MKINRCILFFLIALCCVEILGAGNKPDFVVSDIKVMKDKFIYIQLRNRSANDFNVTPAIKGKIFLAIYINNIKRAEYKVKYIDPKLFKKKGFILFRTNFRSGKGLKIKVEINRLRIIPESDFSNNTLTKQPAS